MKKQRLYLPVPVRLLIGILVFFTGFACFPANVFSQDGLPSVSLFDGKTLAGWKTIVAGDQPLWTVVDGKITGGNGIDKVKSNSYLCTEKEFEDFELRFLFRLSGDASGGMINSGVQYRSAIKGGDIIGYQADIGNGYWGDIYDEHRRGQLVAGDLTVLKKLLKEDGWNSYIVRVIGNRHELYINGVKTADYVEKDNNIPSKGVIGVQLHSGGAAKIEISDITITEF
ncbi:MAG: DUF1080 domain-containing protein [Chitinophagaceae bacterium]|nr:DUF1080 domain-containing protein [Chitinophagaceae bacterium]MCW5929698.1 DUF1080 domain-containing protein [Chitinophagaceae bacterium]